MQQQQLDPNVNWIAQLCCRWLSDDGAPLAGCVSTVEMLTAAFLCHLLIDWHYLDYHSPLYR